ncbi:putative rhamnogalacturonan acetylesterase YesY [Posidoniimonas corsicana]|uniref:Putative rhamnogalacturonan acetylesterase YesY n=1 Tax=Posidoniimonas corsicana TaxID=1938618 RepID=A0A5C5VI21_9BACT|nr:rhamnogalacturonan acetylesterase [Posidoniimonas corsicana]TWT37405.1 putative rhamnogalacturonan acetylesterase YesY [Posidoniimonas corsicana]
MPALLRCPLIVLALAGCCLSAHAADDQIPTLYVAGDSTAANGADGARGWGRHLGKFFDAERVQVENRARGGRSSRTFVTEGLWEQIRSELKPGDVVLIQFGHNDGGRINDPRRARGSLPGLGEETSEIDNEQTGRHEVVHTFGWYLRKMIDETRAAGAEPVLLSLTVRNIWKDGHVERGSGRYGRWTREVAEAENTPFIDLTSIAADKYERMGQAEVGKLFPRDHTHTGDDGALLNARLVVEGFKGLREEMWAPWLSVEGRNTPRAAPQYVRFPSVRRGATEAGKSRFLNTPHRIDDALPTLWLIGDSTVRTGRGRGEGGQFGWGDPLEDYFDRGKINVVNRAMGGTGARTFRTGRFWQPVLEQLRPGDVVLMQFGHNDNGSRGALRGVGDQTEEQSKEDGQTETVETFGAYLRRFIAEIRDKGAVPIVCSLIPRKSWDGDAIRRPDDGHAAWARQVAEDEDVRFIDLYERIAQRYDALGPEAVDPLFADRATHTSYDGAVLNAACVVDGLRDLDDNPLKEFMLGNATPATRQQSADGLHPSENQRQAR